MYTFSSNIRYFQKYECIYKALRQALSEVNMQIIIYEDGKPAFFVRPNSIVKSTDNYTNGILICGEELKKLLY